LTPSDFRRLALSLPGTEAGSHMGAEDFRVGGRIYATLAHAAQGFGNLMLNPETQAAFIAEAPDIYLPVPGGWGRQGATHVRLKMVDEPTLQAALRSAWSLRLRRNEKGTAARKKSVW
jgi:hypothetical protein